MPGKSHLWLVVFFVAVVGLRVSTPSDLFDNDQAKTVAYTVDMVAHGRWAQPRDMLGEPTTKPPMYNWLGAPFVEALGPREWVLKMPAILAAAATGVVIVLAGRSMMGGGELGAVAACLWLASPMGFKLVYLARPDGVLVAFMTGAWWCATVAMGRESGGWGPALGFWLCVAGAALSKGPVALIAVAYVPLAAKLVHGRWRVALRLRWGVGTALVLALVGGWLAAAYLSSPAGFEHGLVGDLAHTKGSRPLLHDILNSMWRMPMQFLLRFAPWSVIAVLWLVDVPPRRWFRHPLGPAALWVLLVVGVFAVFPRHRADYIAPACGPAALLAAGWLSTAGRRWGLMTPGVLAVCAAIVLGLALNNFCFNRAATTQYGEHTRRFVAAVRQRLGNQRVTCIDTGYNPLQPLLGINDAPGEPAPGHPWVIRPVARGDRPVLRSEPISEVTRGQPAVVGLFPPAPSP